jgi:hypothetical protein
MYNSAGPSRSEEKRVIGCSPTVSALGIRSSKSTRLSFDSTVLRGHSSFLRGRIERSRRPSSLMGGGRRPGEHRLLSQSKSDLWLRSAKSERYRSPNSTDFGDKAGEHFELAIGDNRLNNQQLRLSECSTRLDSQSVSGGGCSPALASTRRRFTTGFRLSFSSSTVARPVGVVPSTTVVSSLQTKWSRQRWARG